MLTVFGLGMAIGKNQYNKVPNNIQIEAKSLISELVIKEVNTSDKKLTITFGLSINKGMDELIKSNIINTTYETPVSAQILTLDNQTIELVYTDSEYKLDLSKDSTFTLTFQYADDLAEVISDDSFQSVNVTFKMNQDPTNIFDYVTSHVFQ